MHAILSSLFVWNLIWKGRQAALYSVARDRNILFIFFPFGAMDQGNFRAVASKSSM